MDDDVETIDLLDDFHVYKRRRFSPRQENIGNFPERECPSIHDPFRYNINYDKHNRAVMDARSWESEDGPVPWYDIIDSNYAPDGTRLPLFCFEGGIVKKSFRRLCSRSLGRQVMEAAKRRERKLDIEAYEEEFPEDTY